MTNRWKINDIDIWESFGVYIFRGNYNELLTPPTPRKRLEHEYADRDGVAVDTTSPLTFEARRFNMKVGLRGNSPADFWNKYTAFFALLAQAGSFTLYIADLARSFTLLYEGVARAEKLTPINTQTGVVYATFEIKLFEPVQETTPALNPDLLMVVDGVVTVVNNPSDVFTETDNKLYLNID